jgi:uncharacterized membrane protein YdjX (TVP38/TMEM64 family)
MSNENHTQLFKRLGPAGPMTLITLVLPALTGFVLLANVQTVSEWFRSHGTLGIIAYVLLYAIGAGLAILPTWPISALGGFAFGAAVGVPSAVCGYVMGAVLAYEIGRVASRDRVEQIIQERPKWAAVRRALVGESSNSPRRFFKSLGTVILLRLPPNSPFAFMNMLLAAVRTPRPAFILGTAIGMAPRTSLTVMIGAGIKQALTKDAVNAATPKWVYYGGIALSVVIVMIISSIAKAAISRIADAPADQPPSAPAA